MSRSRAALCGLLCFFFFNAPATTEIYTLSLHDALPIFFALDYDMNGNYISRLTMGDMYHDREINTGGGIGEFHISYSENYGNVFYYGGSIGIRRVKYDENRSEERRVGKECRNRLSRER